MSPTSTTTSPAKTETTALGLAAQIQNQSVTAVSLVEKALQTIEAQEPQLGAYITLTKDLALETASTVDARAKKGDTLSPLAGVPIAIKDNMNVTGYPTTCASKILTGYVSPYNATAYEKLKANLLPVVGKTNLDEFAMGSSTENSSVKLTKNPWDLDRVPGGSSGGSIATVSANQVPLALGSDTGGSVRQPAALCGITGLKPTYGLVSRYGLVAYGSSLDQISPCARNTKDVAALLQVIAGHDPMDATSLKNPVPDYLANIAAGIAGKKIGVIQELNGDGMQAEVTESFVQAQETLKALGASIDTISIKTIPYAVPVYYLLATAEASSNLARFDGVRYGLREAGDTNLRTMYKKTRAAGFGPEVKRRIMLGTFALSAGYYDAYYGKAQKARYQLRKELDQAFSQFDILICPTSPTTAFKFGEKVADPVSMYLSDIATIPVNLAGIPAMSIPCGFDQQGLPIGLQLMGPKLSEVSLLQTAFAFEEQTGLCNLKAPALSA